MSSSFSKLERRSVAALSSIYALRMFGLFLILPVLSIYADVMENSTPLLVGMALGAYGFAQALLQIPFGMLSDRLGRKQVITLGLLIFIIGSLVAAASNDIIWIIIGRAIQGAGAIAAAVLALTADLTRENQRSKAMAFIGMSIGLSFMLALLLSTTLAVKLGFNGLFVLTAILAVLAIGVLWLWVPTPMQRPSRDTQAVPADVLHLVQDSQLFRLNIGVFVLHFVLTAMFVVVPLLLSKELKFATENHWQVYLPVLIASVFAMIPLIMVSASKNMAMRVFTVAICLLLVSQALFITKPISNTVSLAFVLFFFFWGFNTLEAMLPSLVTRLAPPATKGTAVGIYNTFQFAGVFLGGLLGGLFLGRYGYQAVFVLCGGLLVLWVIVVLTAPVTRLYDSQLVSLSALFSQCEKYKPVEAESHSSNSASFAEQIYHALSDLQGVEAVTVIEEEQVAYLKIDKESFDFSQLTEIENGRLFNR